MMMPSESTAGARERERQRHVCSRKESLQQIRIKDHLSVQPEAIQLDQPPRARARSAPNSGLARHLSLLLDAI